MNHTEPAHTSAAAAAERLALTRLHLRQALGVPAANAGSPQNTNGMLGARLTNSASATSATTAAATSTTGLALHSSPSSTPTPAAQLLLATLRAWWVRHPLHTAGRLALQTADAAARPVAQQHPVALLLAAAACGAALAWARPWRQLNGRVVMAALVPGVLPGLLPGLLTSLMPLLTPTKATLPLWTRLLGALLPSTTTAPSQATAPSSRARPHPK